MEEKRGRFNKERESVFQYWGKDVWESAKEKLCPQQKEAVEAVVSRIKQEEPHSEKPYVVVMPTGSGKTGVICVLPYALSARKVLIIAPSLQIRNQIALSWGLSIRSNKVEEGEPEKCFFYKLDIFSRQEDGEQEILPRGRAILWSGDLQDAATQLGPLHITNPHKFRQDPEAAWREMDVNRYDLIIVDEAHHLPASFWQEILDHFSGAKKVFLTATPYKNGQETICPDLEERIAYRLTRKMAETRHLIRPMTFVCVADESELLSKVYEQVMERGTSGVPCKAIIAAYNKPEAKRLEEAINALRKEGDDFMCVAYHSGLPLSNLRNFERANSKRAIVVVKMLLEGYDHPEISVAAIATNIRSMLKFAQFVGRAVRVHDADPQGFDAIILGKRAQQRHFDRLDQFVGDDEAEQKATQEDDDDDMEQD